MLFSLFLHFVAILIQSIMVNDLFCSLCTTWALQNKFSIFYSNLLTTDTSNLIPRYSLILQAWWLKVIEKLLQKCQVTFLDGTRYNQSYPCLSSASARRQNHWSNNMMPSIRWNTHMLARPFLLHQNMVHYTVNSPKQQHVNTEKYNFINLLEVRSSI